MSSFVPTVEDMEEKIDEDCDAEEVKPVITITKVAAGRTPHGHADRASYTVCRTCMEHNNRMQPLFQGGLARLLATLADVSVQHEDGLPQELCCACVSRLRDAVYFKQLCERSDTLFRNLKTDVKAELCEDEQDYEDGDGDAQPDSEDYFPCKEEPLRDSDSDDTEDEIGDNEIPIEPNLKKPITKHKDLEKCKYCEVEVFTKSLMNKHVRFCHPEYLPKKKRSLHVVKTEDGLRADDIMVAINGGTVATIKKDGEDVSDNLVLKVVYRCDRCDVSYDSQQSYAAHMSHHPADGTDAAFPRDANGQFPCGTCGKMFLKRKNLKRHSLIHLKEVVKCTLCEKTFTRPDRLILHMNTHTGKKLHQCPHCEKAFNMSSSLKDHMRTHTGDKPFLCAVCGKGFSQNNNLKQHLMRHTATKPFECPTCQARFISKGELGSHARKHTGEHPFLCGTCGTGFTTSGSLAKHRRIHTGEKRYECEFCGRRFTALATLKNHRRTHTGEKPYACTHCERAFAQRSDLVSHLKRHKQERSSFEH